MNETIDSVMNEFDYRIFMAKFYSNFVSFSFFLSNKFHQMKIAKKIKFLNYPRFSKYVKKQNKINDDDHHHEIHNFMNS